MRDFPYTVKAGDSFSKIARVRYGAEKAFLSLASYNKVDPKSTLSVGKKLNLPETLFYNDVDVPSNSVVVRQANVILPEIAEHVAGPTSIKIGDKAEFSIDRFKAGVTDDDKANSGWKIDVFFKDGTKKETLEPEKAKVPFITSTPTKLTIDKVPGSWASGTFQVFPVVRKVDTAISVKTSVGMKTVELSRSKQRPGHFSRKSKSYTDVADDMVFNDLTGEQYQKLGLFAASDDQPEIPSTPFVPGRKAGLLRRSDSELFNVMESMCLFPFASTATSAMRATIRKVIGKFKDKGPIRVANWNTLKDAFTDTTLTSEAVAHPSTKKFLDEAKANTVREIKAKASEINDVTEFKMSFHPIYGTQPSASDILDPGRALSTDATNGLKILINDTWAYDIDLVDFFLENAKSFKGKIKITIYDHFGLDEDDIKKFGFFDGFRAWFILQHVRGYPPFWTVIEAEAEIGGTL